MRSRANGCARPVGVGLLLAAGLLACARGEPARGRVLIVALDGAAPRLVERLLAAGRLPHLASLARDGAHGRIRSQRPLESPRIWNSVATGMSPPRHGILGFSRSDGAGGTRLFLSTDRRVPALWNIADEAGATVGVVNWWNTYPPARVDGVMISDHVFPAAVAGRRSVAGAREPPAGPLAYPVDWALEPGRAGAPEVPDPPAPAAPLPAWMNLEHVAEVTRRDALRLQIAEQIERELRPDLAMVLLTSIDRASHVLWIAVEPDTAYPPSFHLSEAERRAARSLLEGIYEWNDALLGRLLASYAPEDLVLVVSDHGFEAGTQLGVLTGVHDGPDALDGVVFARGAGIEPGTPVHGFGVLDVTPTVLAWWGLPVGEDMEGRVASFVGVPRPETIPSWAGIPLERLPLRPSGREEELLEELRALGYVE